MKFENTDVWGFNHAIRGMRNPLSSWDKSDTTDDPFTISGVILGDKDKELAMRLISSGPEHRKFLRQIFVSVDITAPLYWWKEFDTYKVGTTANSTSTMHTMAKYPITIDCFETGDMQMIDYPEEAQREGVKHYCDPCFVQMHLIPYLEYLRQQYLATKDKTIWKELIRWLPESWLQTRTVTMDYENLLSMYRQRKNHKLNEWHWFIDWIHTLPHAELIINDGDNND